MKGNLRIIRPNGTEYGERLTSPPDLARLHEIVGGYIEQVPYFRWLLVGNVWRPCVAFCNEEGKLARPVALDPNPRATRLWSDAMRRQPALIVAPDTLVGNIAIVFGDKNFMRAMRNNNNA